MTGAASSQALISRIESVRVRYHVEVVLFVAATLSAVLFALGATNGWTLLGALDQPLGLATLATLLAIAAAGIILWLRAPRSEQIARRADLQFGNAERLSSAQPLLHQAPERLGLLGPSLLEDAAGHSEGLVGFRIAIPGVVMGVAAVVIISLSIAIALRGHDPPTLADVASSGSVEEQAPTENLSGDQVEQLRGLLAADAARLDKPYLEAVANSFDQFAQAAPDMASAERAEKLQGLLDHAAAAYGSSRPGWLPPDTGNFAALSAGLERQATSAMLAATSPAAGSVPLPDEWDPTASDPTLRSAEALQDFLAEAGAGATAGPLLPADDLSQAGTSMPPLNQFELRPLDPGKLLSASPAGASVNADEGASTTAGLGSQPLSKAQLETTQPGFGAEMTLSSDASRPGNLIRIEVAPEQAFTDVDGTVGSAAGVEDDNRPLLPVFRTAISPADRTIVARYFVENDAPMTSGL
ncbi:hypothetical protein [Devosia naphthalenivorans]|uniref:hypothetical protein n=1 Tax=Devosia naphthalenivorans TaxID=2082392 RepID=UPI0013B06488|nr:hypothetical protein [Devosia naphthalenivorans]